MSNPERNRKGWTVEDNWKGEKAGTGKRWKGRARDKANKKYVSKSFDAKWEAIEWSRHTHMKLNGIKSHNLTIGDYVRCDWPKDPDEVDHALWCHSFAGLRGTLWQLKDNGTATINDGKRIHKVMPQWLSVTTPDIPEENEPVEIKPKEKAFKTLGKKDADLLLSLCAVGANASHLKAAKALINELLGGKS